MTLERQPDIDDVEFIYAEIEKFLTMRPDDLRAHWRASPPLEALHMLPHPSGRGELFLGKNAYMRFNVLARRHLAAQPERRVRVASEKLADALRKEFVRRFLKDFQQITNRSVAEMFDSAYKDLATSFQRRTYYLPCSIVQEQNPAEFKVGPVSFIKRSLFWERHHSDIEREKVRTGEELRNRWSASAKTPANSEDAADQQAKVFADDLFRGVQEFFGLYDWLAIVETPPADEKISEDLANSLVGRALNVLKLLMGASHSDQISMGSAAPIIARTAQLVRDSDGRFHPTLEFSTPQNSVGNDWFSYIRGPCALYLSTAGILLTRINELFVPTGISTRFLDALHWFGDAVTEPNPAAQLAKYVFALERATVISSGRRKRVKSKATVSNRSAVFWKQEPKPLYEWTARIREIYEARSDLAHGSRSPFSEDLPSLVSDASKVARMTLLGLLGIMQTYGYEVPDEQLIRIYSDLESRAFLTGWPWIVTESQ